MFKFDFSDNDWERILIGSVLVIILLTVNAWIIQLCWNNFLVNAISGLHEIDMWQALAIRIFVQTAVTGFSVERQQL